MEKVTFRWANMPVRDRYIMISEKISMDCWKSQGYVTRTQSKLKGHYSSDNLQETCFSSRFLGRILDHIGNINDASDRIKAPYHTRSVIEIRRKTEVHFEIDRQIHLIVDKPRLLT